MAVAISMAKSFGVRQMALPTVGSGGASLAAYCRRASIEAFIFCPEDLPQVTMREIAAYGARFYAVNGALEDCNPDCRRRLRQNGLVQHLDSEGAVPHRRQEDDGPTNSQINSAGNCPT